MKTVVDVDVFVFDLDGTIYLGDSAIGDSINTLKRLEEMGKKVFFLTNNSSKGKGEYTAKMAKLGYNCGKNQLLTSTMATINYLNKNCANSTVYPVGTPGFVEEIKEGGINVVEEGADIVLLAYDTTLTYEKMKKANLMLLNGSDFIATHPDDVCPSEAGDLPDVGAFLAMFKRASKREPRVICGKPNPPMAALVESVVGVAKDRIAMVGDRLYTDIAFGIKNGYKSVAVLSGETTLAEIEASDLVPSIVLGSVNDLIV
ncbi:MAG: HAD-IIA family hydrolase [Bacillota bacterium]